MMLKKPVIILSAPRSGSTLLFEILTAAKNIWTIGDESHALIESIPQLRIESNQLSNRLTEARATPEIIAALHGDFLAQLRDRNKVPADPGSNDVYRLLEKTPKNSLRVSFLNKVFPDATYIYLVRDPCEAVSSIMEAWKSGKWTTYRNLPNWGGPWSMLLPPGWGKFVNLPLENVAAFQWASANQHIIDDLNSLQNTKVVPVSYFELINDTSNQVRRLCDQCEIEFDEKLDEFTRGALPYSKYTQTVPREDKWRKNSKEIETIQPKLTGIVNKIDNFLQKKGCPDMKWYVNKPVESVS